VSLATTESFSRALGDAKVLNKLREPYKSQGYCQDRARTFHLPRDSAVVHFNGSRAVLHHLLVQASGVFVKCCVSCLIPRWNQTGNTESIRLWRKGTTVVHKRETESRNTASTPRATPCRDHRQYKQQVEVHEVSFFEKRTYWRCWCSPVFSKQTIPTEFAPLYTLQLKDLLEHVRLY